MTEALVARAPTAAAVRTATTTRLFRPFDDFSCSEVRSVEQIHPGTLDRIKRSLAGMEGLRLSRDLEIRMPRLEEIDVAAELQRSRATAASAEESLSDDICKYVSLLAQFNNYVGQGLEEAVVAWLNERADEWRPEGTDWFFARNTVQFPDIVLVEPDSDAPGKYRVLFHMEVKTWYVFAKDLITARFHTAPSCIKPDALLLVFPWYMTEVVYGVPFVLAPLAYNARELADRRDKVWAGGGKRQADRGEVSTKFKVSVPDPDDFFTFNVNTQNVKSEAYQLTAAGAWVKDADNFGKIHRFYYGPIYDFESTTLGHTLKGRTLKRWRKLLFGDAAEEG